MTKKFHVILRRSNLTNYSLSATNKYTIGMCAVCFGLHKIVIMIFNYTL